MECKRCSAVGFEQTEDGLCVYCRRIEALEAEVEQLKGESVFELVEWTELRDGKEVVVDTSRFGDGQFLSPKVWRLQVKGPLEGIMVVVPSYEELTQAGPAMMDQVAEIILKSAKRVLRESGWEGEVILVPSNIKLLRFRRVEGA
jgi:hypothetical protein